MTAYLELGAFPRSLICFWAILLIFSFVMNTALAVLRKQYFAAAAAVAAILPPYFIMQICRNVTKAHLGSALHPFAESVGNLPYIAYIILLLVLTLAYFVHLYMSIIYTNTHIAPTAIKEAMDRNPTGICYYRDNGQVILTNHRMNLLSFAIAGRALLNGIEFYDVVRDKRIIELSDGTVVRFSHKRFTFSGEPCHELIADDITELYQKNKSLRQDNERLQQQNQRMKAFGETIDETVRRQEILHTKTRIHDEMNRLLLSTDNAVRCGTEAERQTVLKTWEKNILLLCMEADTLRKSNALSDLDALSKVIGVTISYDALPETEDANTLRLFSLAAEEAMTNAAKHGGAKNLYVHVLEDEFTLTASFENDGNPPVNAFVEGGGLSTLRQHIERSGGTMHITAEERFVLTVMIPKKRDLFSETYPIG